MGSYLFPFPWGPSGNFPIRDSNPPRSPMIRLQSPRSDIDPASHSCVDACRRVHPLHRGRIVAKTRRPQPDRTNPTVSRLPASISLILRPPHVVSCLSPPDNRPPRTRSDHMPRYTSLRLGPPRPPAPAPTTTPGDHSLPFPATTSTPAVPQRYPSRRCLPLSPGIALPMDTFPAARPSDRPTPPFRRPAPPVSGSRNLSQRVPTLDPGVFVSDEDRQGRAACLQRCL